MGNVLIVGAGPTGLTLALWLTRFGIPVRIVDKAPGPGTTSRALVVHARILEHYAQLGLAERLIALGVPLGGVNLWVNGERAAHASFGEMGRGLSPYPYALICPQDVHERFLVEVLAAEGVEVERDTEVVELREEAQGVRARLKRASGGTGEVHAAYVAGCDGAHSIVRHAIGAGFPGGTYAHRFYVADVSARGELLDRQVHIALDAADLLAAFALVDTGHVRLVGMLRDAAREGESGWDDVRKDALRRLPLEVQDVHWFSTYQVHHRVAREFRRGRAFLLGDAAHIHSPVGGQGMNTGIGDAVNLAWKLAAVIGAGWPARTLESYECERRAFAQKLVRTTDRAFTFASRDGFIARFVRTRVFPAIVPRVFGTGAGRRFAFRTLSQIGVQYRDCPLSAGTAGGVHGGDRLPWVPLPGDARGDNFSALRSLHWQMHVYGRADPSVERYCAQRRFELHVFPWRDGMEHAGLARDAFYLVRPDGYVASASRSLAMPAPSGT
ncbi:MAG TPA: FAD-dependent monooxygenase [Usitatibacter sp.]|jgi:2-polyprenyl-6-methoxyphenol hydroxylase-like FAD-dependent oxidoreductase|nr:FAD-dependent monooxygenase [Usitatibacter sp.]